MPEELNFDEKTKDEIVDFIMKKTGCKSFVLGICADTIPCEDDKAGRPCSSPKGHLIKSLAVNVEPQAWGGFTHGVYMALERSIQSDALKKTESSKYEPSTT